MSDENYWDFANVPARSGSHAFFQYPAMMVPELQGALLDDLRSADPSVRVVYDPFMGSGTVMLESLYRGLDFHGSDINPMAVLLSSVKADPPSGELALVAVRWVAVRAREMEQPCPFDFPNRDKWFKLQVAADLSRLRSAIQLVEDLRIRRFLWVCLAETVRVVSNSRTSTFKLHVYAADVLRDRSHDAIAVFGSIGKNNAAHAATHWQTVMSRSSTSNDAKVPSVTLLRGGVDEPWSAPRLADVLMTSPPYGDNRTTVPYGQHSYLPLRWLDHRDLVGTFDSDLLSSTARIDSLSLGGSIVGAEAARAHLVATSPSFGNFLTLLDGKSVLEKKVLSFARDYAAALEAASERLRAGGFSFWTLGERRVDRAVMPLVAFTEEILSSLGHERVSLITRRLPRGRKRMAVRNSHGDTMAHEYILVMQKALVA